jgi:anti-anti-sigma factor
MQPGQHPQAMIRFYGELDIAVRPLMRRVLSRMLDYSPCLIADLSAVEFIDACALGVLLTARHHAMKAGGSLTITAPSPAVTRLLGLLNLDAALCA